MTRIPICSFNRSELENTNSKQNNDIFEGLKQPNCTVLAPLSGVTDAAFREISRRQGCGFVYAEMTSSDAIVDESRKADRRLQGFAAPVPLVAQLLGYNSEVIAAVAQLCAE